MKIISDSLVLQNLQNNSQTDSVINKTYSFDNQSYLVFHIGLDYENSLQTSRQTQFQRKSRVSARETQSLPLPWIAAIVINAILVFLFVVFITYCYCKSRKRRQRLHNTDKDSLFSGKSSKHSVQEVPKSETKENIFNIESEHKRLTEKSESVESESEAETGRKTSIKSPMTKIQSVARLSSSMRGHDTGGDQNHYNPTDSPTVSQFTNHLSASVPNQSEYIAKHEQQEDNQISEELEPLTELEDEQTTNDYGLVEQREQISWPRSPKASPTKSIKQLSPKKEMTSSPTPSLSAATHIMGRVKGLAHHSPRKSASPERRGVSPASDHSSHSTAVQTSPQRNWSDIPGAIDDDYNYFDERRINLRPDVERKYFVYIIKDVNPYTRKECIGRVTLPARQRMTLEQLRHFLMQSDDEIIRNCAKRKFKFLSESYRLVVMNESYTPVDQVYQTQGIFIKFSAGDSLPFGYRSKNKYRTGNRDTAETESNYSTRTKPQLASVTRSIPRSITSKKSDSVYGSSLRPTQRKDSNIYGEYGSSYGTTPAKSYAMSSVYGSVAKRSDRSDRSRFGYEWTPVNKEERSYVTDRTPRKREERERMTTSRQYMATPMDTTPAVSARSRMRLCQKNRLKEQVARGQLEKMPSFITSSLELMCDNTGCTNKPVLKCLVCTQLSYCSTNCKKQHWNSDHKFTCKRPPWKG